MSKEKKYGIQYSELTGKVYAGEVKGGLFVNKIDATSDFIAAAIAKWAGYKETLSDGEYEYIITVKKRGLSQSKTKQP